MLKTDYKPGDRVYRLFGGARTYSFDNKPVTGTVEKVEHLPSGARHIHVVWDGSEKSVDHGPSDLAAV